MICDIDVSSRNRARPSISQITDRRCVRLERCLLSAVPSFSITYLRLTASATHGNVLPH